MKRIALVTIVLLLAVTAPVATAQEAQETLYVSATYISVKPGMNQAFMAAMADHTEWHRSTGDTHYFSVSQAISGPRTGQMVVLTALPAAELDAAAAFADQDMGDIAQRGMFQYIDSVETIVRTTMPNLGNPPPDGYWAPMVHVYEVDLKLAKVSDFMEALGKLDEAEKAVGMADDYNIWLAPVSGTSVNKRWIVGWVDGWADTSNPDPERRARVVEAAGGEEAHAALLEVINDAVNDVTVTTYMNLQHLSFQPEGR